MRSIVFLAVLTVGCSEISREQGLREDGMLNRLAEEYSSERVRFYPVEATEKGHHDFDGELGKFGREDIQARLVWLQDFRQRLLGVDVAKASRPAYLDLLLITSAVKAEILELAQIESWKRSPLFYDEGIRSGLTLLLVDEPLSEARINALLSRLEQVPSFLETARANIDEPPRVLVEEGIRELRRTQVWIRDLPSLLEGAFPRRLSELGDKSRRAARALQRFVSYLESDALPNARPSFALGIEKLSQILLYREMDDVLLADLRADAEEKIHEMQTGMREASARLDNSASVQPVLAQLSRVRPPSSEVIPLAKETLQEVKQFTTDHGLTSHEIQDSLQIIATPARLSDARSIFLVTPGPLELDPKPFLLMLTLPSPHQAPQLRDSGLVGLNSRAIRLSMVREGYPGKFLYESMARKPQSRTRKMVASKAFREGWGLYVEQLLLEEGYGWEDPLLSLAHLQRMLVEQCRLVTGVGLHAEGMSLSAAVALFRDKAYLSPDRAEREARAVVADPTRWSAALGHQQIRRLRERYVDREDPPQALRDFHDALLAAAGLPLRLVEVELKR